MLSRIYEISNPQVNSAKLHLNQMWQRAQQVCLVWWGQVPRKVGCSSSKWSTVWFRTQVLHETDPPWKTLLFQCWKQRRSKQEKFVSQRNSGGSFVEMKVSPYVSVPAEEESSSWLCVCVVKLRSDHRKLCVVNPWVTLTKWNIPSEWFSLCLTSDIKRQGETLHCVMHKTRNLCGYLWGGSLNDLLIVSYEYEKYFSIFAPQNIVFRLLLFKI